MSIPRKEDSPLLACAFSSNWHILFLLLIVCSFVEKLPLKVACGLDCTLDETVPLENTRAKEGNVLQKRRHILQDPQQGNCSTRCGMTTLNWPLSIDDSCGLPAYRLLCDRVFGYLYLNAGGVAVPVAWVGHNFILVGLDHRGFTGGFCERPFGSVGDNGTRRGQFVIDRADDPESAFYLSTENVVVINNSGVAQEGDRSDKLEGYLTADGYNATCSNYTELPLDSFPGCASCCIIPLPKGSKLKAVSFGATGNCHTAGPRIMIDQKKTSSYTFNRPVIRLDFDFPDGFVPASSFSPVAERVQYQCNYCSAKWPEVHKPFNLDDGVAPCGDRGFYLVCDCLKGDLFLSIGNNMYTVVKISENAIYIDSFRLIMGGCGYSTAIFLTLGKAQKLYFSSHNVALAVGCNAMARLETDQTSVQRCNMPCNQNLLDGGLSSIPSNLCEDNFCCNTTFPGDGKSLIDNAGQFTFAMEGGKCGQSLAVIGDPSTFNITENRVWLKLVYGFEESLKSKTEAGRIGTIVGSVLGSFLLVAFTCVFVWWRKHRRKRLRASSRTTDLEASKRSSRLARKSLLSCLMRPFSGQGSEKEGSLHEMKLPPLSLPCSHSPACVNQWDPQVVPSAGSSAGNSGENNRKILAGKIVFGDLSLLQGTNGDTSERLGEGCECEPATVSKERGAEEVPGLQGPNSVGPNSVGASSDSVCGMESELASEDRLLRTGSDASDKVGGIDMRSLLPIQLSEIDLRMENMIGGGGYGRVYRWERLGTQYAVKVVRGEPQELRDLWQEVVLLKELRHPNVVQFIFACEKPPNEIYIVMEYVQKGSLYKLLHETKQSLSTRQKVHMALDVAKGMAFLHEINVVHRDLKSANLLVSHDGTIKVCDFGQSRLLNGTHLTTDNRAGTLPYTAPEAFEDFQRCPKESDVYAYGIILWELFSGEIPWNKYAEVEIMKNIVMDKSRPPISPDWPPPVIDIITRCWAQEPQDRPTFASLTTELKVIMNSLPSEPKAPSRRRLRTPNGNVTPSVPLDVHEEVQKEAG